MATNNNSTGTILGMAPKTARNWGIAAGVVALLGYISPKKTLAGAGGLVAGGAKGALTGIGVGFLGGGALAASLTALTLTAFAVPFAAPLIATSILVGLIGGVVGAGKGAMWGAAVGGVSGVYKGVKREGQSELENTQAGLENAKLDHQRAIAENQRVASSLGYAPQQQNNPYVFDNPYAQTGHASQLTADRQMAANQLATADRGK